MAKALGISGSKFLHAQVGSTSFFPAYIPPLYHDVRRLIMQNARLPVEVCERIIDYCIGHPGTLYSCSLTCRSWVPRTRIWLFEIRYVEYRDDLKRLTAALKSQPENGTFLYTLVIVGGDDRDLSWINAVPRQLAPLLPNLRELRFTSVSFLNLHPTFMTSVTTLLHKVTTLYLRSPHFSTFNQAMRFLLAFPHLSDLTINALSWKTRGRHTPTIGQLDRVQAFTLSSLSLRQHDSPQAAEVFVDILRFMMSSSAVSSLKTLDLRLPGDAKVALQASRTVDAFLAACKSSLEHLTLEYSHAVGPDVDTAGTFCSTYWPPWTNFDCIACRGY